MQETLQIFPQWLVVLGGMVMSFVTAVGTLLAWKHYQEKDIEDLRQKNVEMDKKFVLYQLKEVCLPQHNMIAQGVAMLTQSLSEFKTDATKRFDKIDGRIDEVIRNGKHTSKD